MRPGISRFFLRFLFVLLILFVSFTGFAIFSVRRSFPRTSGEIHLNGLKSAVDVVRDAYGVPHIYASNPHDLFFAQGYVHAQDRFWQMDFWRHVGSGRLSELFGKSQIKTDRFLRTMGWARIVEKELKQLDPISISILQAYSQGVNSYLTGRSGSALSLEHGLLKLSNRSYAPEPWTPLHSLTWGKAMAWDLGQNMDDEIYRAILLKTLSQDRVEELYPPYPSINPLIFPQEKSFLAQITNGLQPETLALLGSVTRELKAISALHNASESGIGSNNWVISGGLTSTGKPLLANDPHLGIQMPSIWYQAHLICRPQTSDCPFQVAGFSFAGVPGIVLGHNAHIAWGFTNVGPDVMDLYIEKINPANPNEYEVNGTWKQMEMMEEQIRTSEGETIPTKIRYTRHGPVISDVSDAVGNIDRTQGENLPGSHAISLRWTALEPTIVFPAIWKINQASNWHEFREAASHFDVPSQNIVFADVEGNIGYQVPGLIPVRNHGDGRYPVPGWTDEYEWTGYIPFDELPSSFNPSQGYVATANNAIMPPQYSHFISDDWDYGYRARRIVEMIENRTSPISISDIQKMQGDNKNYNAEFLVPFLLKAPMVDKHLSDLREILRPWDFQESADSTPAALFEVFWLHLLADTVHDDLPEQYWPGGGNRWVEIVRNLLQQPKSQWWDNKKTAATETRDDILVSAFQEAVKELEQKFGKNPATWQWGNMHVATFRNSTFGKSGISVIKTLVNRGPYPTGGSSVAVNSTSWDASNGNYEVTWIPSMRMIVDLSNLGNSLAIHSTGQSGHPFHPHYIDMAEPWRKVEYLPMLWDQTQIEANSEGRLKLLP